MLLSDGEKVLIRRRRLGWTQQELSEISGVSRNTIACLERNEIDHPQPETLLKLFKGLELEYCPLQERRRMEEYKEVLQKIFDLIGERAVIKGHRESVKQLDKFQRARKKDRESFDYLSYRAGWITALGKMMKYIREIVEEDDDDQETQA